jgi:hypothetical protein
VRDYEFKFDQDRSHARKLMAYLSKAEGYGEDEDTVWAAADLRDTMRQRISDLQPAMPDKIGSVVLAPLHRDEGLVEWVYDGSRCWHHGDNSRLWWDLDVYEIVRHGTDVSDQQHLRRRMSGLVGVILESHDRSWAHSGQSDETVEALKGNYLLQARFLEDMLTEIDPRYKRRAPKQRPSDPIEMGTETAAETSEVGA